MTEALLFVGVGSLLAVSVAILALAALTLWHARRYVELAEERLEHLHEGQARLAALLLEERRHPKEEPKREREQRPKVLQLTRQEGQEWERLEAERRIEQVKRDLLEPRKLQRNRAAEQESSLPLSEFLAEEPLPAEETQGAGGMPHPTSFLETRASGAPPQDERPRLAVWYPHPDDDVSPRRASAGRARAPGDTPVKMFRKHYDRYLENYEGYVKLAERIYQMQDNAEVAPGSLADREWEERLRRVNDGIKRTTARLDILEEYNPELATDDRISHRASIARSHSELERDRRGRS